VILPNFFRTRTEAKRIHTVPYFCRINSVRYKYDLEKKKYGTLRFGTGTEEIRKKHSKTIYDKSHLERCLLLSLYFLDKYGSPQYIENAWTLSITTNINLNRSFAVKSIIINSNLK
jgi:hypothetical protein